LPKLIRRNRWQKKGGLAAINDYWTLAQQLADLGFNINFAPVVDLNLNPENPIIGGLERSYSSDPEIVAGYARTFYCRAPRLRRF